MGGIVLSGNVMSVDVMSGNAMIGNAMSGNVERRLAALEQAQTEPRRGGAVVGSGRARGHQEGRDVSANEQNPGRQRGRARLRPLGRWWRRCG